MNTRQLLSLVGLSLISSCLSQNDPQVVRYFTAAPPELAGESVPGTKPLRFDRIQSPPLLTTKMLWRLSEHEVAPDDSSSWAMHPADMFEVRVRDLLFSRQGYRESLDSGEALLSVRVLTMEGVAYGEPEARVNFVADFWSNDGTQQRQRFDLRQPLESLDSEALAAAMAQVMDQASRELVSWIEEHE